jgi:hypothetical protein
MSKLSMHSIRYNANQILVESRAKTATLDNYDYLFNFVKRLDTISLCIMSEQGFENEPVANIVANSIHKAMVALIPSFGLGDFDWEGTGEDLTRLVHGAWVVLRDCGEDGMAQAICDRHNLFVTMCEMQEKLDEQWLTDLAND